MNILDIIDKKEQNQKLTYEELKYVVNGFLNGEIKDYQMSAFLTEIDLLGMSDEETLDLTDIMLKSGEVLNLNINAVDKHSTGGVGDKTTLVLAPLVASLGVNVAKMSGRGLGHTGGTIDKLESIPGFKTNMTLENFQNQVKKIGIALVGTMGNLVPADKKIYALRDVTGTVDSIPLIASSVMSKKIASGSNKIVIDLKVGEGALVNNLKDAEKLGKLMIKIGKHYNKETACLLTNMNEPLGRAVGNALEVVESINTLKGNGPADLIELVTELSSLMVSMEKGISEEEAKTMSLENLKNGQAYRKFLEWVTAQGGDISNIKISQNKKHLTAPKSGYITQIDALEIGKLARNLGAGRLTENDKIDHEVGFVINKKVGDKVEAGETLITVYYNEKTVPDEEVLNCFKIDDYEVKPKLIIEKLTNLN